MRGEAFARQLKLLALLEVRPEGVELEEASEELGARRRTIYRDFRVLEDAGLPLTSAREGRRARWRIMPGYRHRLQLSLTWTELFGLMSAREMVAELAGTLLHDGAASALEKIRATLPRPLAERFRATQGLVSAAPGGRDYRGRGAIVETLVDAIEARKTVIARYRSRRVRAARSAVDRKLDPYHLRAAAGGLYLVARCHMSDAVKVFLVDRFDDVRPTDGRFEPPRDLNPIRLLERRFGMWSGRPRRVSFRVSAGLGDLFMERKLHPSQVAQKRSDGSVEVRLEVPIVPPLVAYLTGLGAGVGELEPRELRAVVAAEHRGALALLEAPTTASPAGRRA